MFHQQFKVSIVRIQFLFVVAAHVPGQLRGHLVYSPAGEGPFQEHLPTAGVYGFPEIQRARFV